MGVSTYINGNDMHVQPALAGETPGGGLDFLKRVRPFSLNSPAEFLADVAIHLEGRLGVY
jgi:hypothetical protein